MTETVPEQQNKLFKHNAGGIASNERAISVGELERALLREMPAADACSWDRTGMLVGNPAATVEGVVVALDPTIAAIEATVAAGANVLVTHHPVFLDAPENFVTAQAQGHTPGAVIRRACQLDINIISFHTALDVSVAGLDALPLLLHLEPMGVLEPLETNSQKGFGRICKPSTQEAPLSLRNLSARCVSVFGSVPRVWGVPEKEIQSVVTSGGAASSFLPECVDAGIDCLICGEVKYHDALNAALSGLAIIELGHDVSEFPLCTVLAAHVGKAGISKSCITVLEQNNWYTPEALRR